MRPRAPLTALGASLCAIGFVQCSLTHDLDSLGNGARDASVDSAPAATIDSSTAVDAGGGPGAPEADASEDGEASAGPGVDAGVDAYDAAPPHAPPTYLDAGATTWCTAHPGTFCADFDEAPLPSGFPSSDGSFLSLTSTTASSSPNDLLLWVPAQDGTSTFSSKLSRNFTEHAAAITAAFDLDPEVLNTTSSGVLFFALDFLGNTQAKYSIRLAFNGGAARVEESYLGGASDQFHPNFPVAQGAWTRVRLQITFGQDAGPSSIGVYLNDVLQGTVDALSPPTDFDSRPGLLVGAVYGTMPHTGWVLRYDNVTIDIQ